MQVTESLEQNKCRKKIKKSTILFILYIFIFIIMIVMIGINANDNEWELNYFWWASLCLILSITFEYVHFKLLSSYANKYVTTTPTKSVLILSCIILLKFTAIIVSAILLKFASHTMSSSIFWLLGGSFLYIIINRIILIYSNKINWKKNNKDGKRS